MASRVGRPRERRPGLVSGKRTAAGERSCDARSRAAGAVSDAERRCRRALQGGRRPAMFLDRTRARRSWGHLGTSDHESAARACRRSPAVSVLLHDGGPCLAGVRAQMRPGDAGRRTSRRVLAATGRRHQRIAPHLTEQGRAGPGRQYENDGQNGCSKHDCPQSTDSRSGAALARGRIEPCITSMCNATDHDGDRRMALP